jgi:hypothetical protein
MDTGTFLWVVLAFAVGALEVACSPNAPAARSPSVLTCPASRDAVLIRMRSPRVVADGPTYYLCCLGCAKRVDPSKPVGHRL